VYENDEGADWTITLDDRLVAADGWSVSIDVDLTDATDPELVRFARLHGWRG
jgi:hypothetical protein